MMNSAEMDDAKLYLNIFESTCDGVLITDLESVSVLIANPAAAAMHGYTQETFHGLQLTSLVHADSQSGFAQYTELIKRGDQFETLAEHVRRDGSLFSIEWRAVAFTYQGRKCALALLRDVSRQIKAKNRFQQRMGARANEQSILLEISKTLASELDLQPGMILDQMERLIKYTHAGLFTLNDSTLVAQAIRGVDELEKSMPVHIRLNGKRYLEALFNGHRPIRIADIWSDEASAMFLRSLLQDEASAMLEGVQSWMWVPLVAKQRLLGGIGIAHTARGYFTPHLTDLAMTIANLAAVAIVNAELYEHAQELAALQERQRLARNLHDAVNQSLFSAGLIAEVLPRIWEKKPEQARRSLKDLRRLIRGALAEMRSLLAELRPSTLIDTELSDLLRQLGNAFTGRTGIPVAVTVNGAGSVPADVQVAVYRICQEGMNNIAKHARASQVSIDLRFESAGLELCLKDDGCGFVTSELTPAGSFGLSMMRERAEAAGAVLTVSSQPHQGTEVVLQWDRQEES